MATSTESDKYDVLDKIGEAPPSCLQASQANVTGHGSFGIIRKVRRKTDGKASCPGPLCL